MMIPVMLKSGSRMVTTRIRSHSLPLLFLLVIIFVCGSLFIDVRRTYVNVVMRTPTYSNKHLIHDHPIHGRPEKDRIREIYAAVKLLNSEFSSKFTRGLVYDLSILTTREFYTKPRPQMCDNCNRMEFKSLIAPKDLCSGNRTIDLLVQITTIPQEIEARTAVRETWGSLSRNNTASVRCMFLFGSGYDKEDQDIVNDEHKVYEDVLQHDYKDSYYNLTYKVIMGFTWATKHCPRAQFILRTATDNFINLPSLTKYLQKYHDKLKKIQMGRVKSMGRFKHRDSKFYVPYIEYPYNNYPRFATGSAYIYSMNAVKDILVAAPYIPFLALEDVWFGLLMEQINMRPINFDGFDFTPEIAEVRKIPDGTCPRNGSFFAVHFPYPYLIRNLPTEPYQFFYWMWKTCAQYNVSNVID